MDSSLKQRIRNQIFKFEVSTTSVRDKDSPFTLDFEKGRYRQDELVGLIRDAVPYFALTQNEIDTIDKSEWNRQRASLEFQMPIVNLKVITANFCFFLYLAFSMTYQNL